ncbi:hypothetical protein A0J61_07936, partial [Choanephora cucurbitarum]
MLGTLSLSCPNPELRRARSSRLKPWLVLMAANRRLSLKGRMACRSTSPCPIILLKHLRTADIGACNIARRNS